MIINTNYNSGFADEVNRYYEKKNAWRNMNGGCRISADIDDTLKRLSDSVFPKDEQLADKVKGSIAKYSEEGQTIEQIWKDMLAKGANFVGVIDGNFGFYRGEEKLETNNKPLEFSTRPLEFEYREAVKGDVTAKIKAKLKKEMEDLKKDDDNQINGRPIFSQVGCE